MEITILNHTDKKDGVHWQFGRIFKSLYSDKSGG